MPAAISPSPRFAWRSRFEPRGAAASFTCSARSRSRPIRFLPKFDNVLLDRRRVLPEEYRKLVVRKNADVQPTFIVDGLVAGIWSFEGGRVTREPFAPLPRAAKRELEDEAGRLAAWLR